MDIGQPSTLALALALALAVAIAAVATGLACRWWYGRKLAAAAARLQKSENGRLFAHEQALHARRQVEQLKAELGRVEQSASRKAAAERRASDLQVTLDDAERSIGADSGMLPLISAHGFADTQVMPK